MFSNRIQQVSINSPDLSYTHRCNLHIITVALLSLVGRVTGISNIMHYTEKIVGNRVEEATHLLPPFLDSKQNYEHKNLQLPHLMVDKVSVT